MKTEPYFLKAPKDGRDMTAKIEACLHRHGACRLGTGNFATRGIRMPEGTSLFGAGTATKLILSPEVAESTQLTAAHHLILPACDEAVAPFPAMCALQLLAYHTALIMGRDIDKPRNLAKSVTVE